MDELKTAILGMDAKLENILNEQVKVERHLKEINGSISDSKIQIALLQEQSKDTVNRTGKLEDEILEGYKSEIKSSKDSSRWVISLIIGTLLTFVGIIITLITVMSK